MRFGYLRDPLFLACLALYFVNRWLLKSLWPAGFCHSHLNDLICIPFWVPILVWLLRKAGLRASDAAPRSWEIVIPLLVWSAVFELILPYAGPFREIAVADPADILCYALGALVAALTWRACYGSPLEARKTPMLRASSQAES